MTSSSEITNSSWLKRHWPVLLLAAATVLVACCYFPSYCLKGLESDMVIPAIFSWDLLHGGHATDWYWGGAPFIFPDLTAHFLLRFLLGDGIRALEAASALLFIGWIVALVTGYRSARLPNAAVFAALAMMVALGAAAFSLPSFFHSVEHGGAYLVTLLAAGWLLRAWDRGEMGSISLGVWAAVILLTASSDGLILVVFVAPALATLLCGAYFFPARRRLGNSLALVVALAAIPGMLVSRAIFPPHLFTSMYLQIDPAKILDALRTLKPILDPRSAGIIAFLAYGDVIAFVVLALRLAKLLRAGRGKVLPAHYFIVAFSFFLLVMNWSGAILSGNLLGLYTTRYVVLSLVWPVVLLAGWLSASEVWTRGRVRIAVVVAAVIGVVAALHPPAPVYYLYETQVLEPGLADLMKRENCPEALGDYWSANFATATSGGAVRVLPLALSGQACFWFANQTWFQHPPGGGWRIVLPKYQDPEMYRLNFGDPARVVTIGGDEAWVYSAEDAIHYIPAFNTIGNRHGFPDDNTYRTRGAGMFHATGQVEGDAIVAKAGRDRNGWLAQGPGFMPKAGRYRFTYTYAMREAPQKGRGPVFEIIVERPSGPLFLHSEELLYVDTAQHAATAEFTIKPGQEGLLNGQLEFHGSGTVELDQEEVQRLGD